MYTLVLYTIIVKMNMLSKFGFNLRGFDTPESMTHFLGSSESIDLKIQVNMEPRARVGVPDSQSFVNLYQVFFSVIV